MCTVLIHPNPLHTYINSKHTPNKRGAKISLFHVDIALTSCAFGPVVAADCARFQCENPTNDFSAIPILNH